MALRKKKRPLKKQAASATHRVAKSYTNGRRWVVVEEPMVQELPTLQAGRSWFVVRVGPKREDVHDTRLKAQSYPTFVPRYIRTATLEKEKRVTTPVLIPGYMFVASDGSEAEQAQIMGIEGAAAAALKTLEWHDKATGEVFHASVRGAPIRVECEILRSRSTNQPIRIPEGILRGFVRCVSSTTKQAPGAKTLLKLELGSMVRVNDGPFASFIAEVQAVDNGLARVLLDLFGRKSAVEIPIAALELA